MIYAQKNPLSIVKYTERIYFLLFFHQQCDCFCPHGFAELVHATGFFKAISSLKKCLQITCKAGCFTGDIHNTIYPIGKDLRQCFRMDSIARWIQDDHIRLLSQIIQNLQDVTGNEFTVIQSVQLRILS